MTSDAATERHGWTNIKPGARWVITPFSGFSFLSAHTVKPCHSK